MAKDLQASTNFSPPPPAPVIYFVLIFGYFEKILVVVWGMDPSSA